MDRQGSTSLSSSDSCDCHVTFTGGHSALHVPRGTGRTGELVGPSDLQADRHLRLLSGHVGSVVSLLRTHRLVMWQLCDSHVIFSN